MTKCPPDDAPNPGWQALETAQWGAGRTKGVSRGFGGAKQAAEKRFTVGRLIALGAPQSKAGCARAVS
jgi:hypothetical protein